MTKKSAAQLRRLQKRAADRGEEYIPKENTSDENEDTTNVTSNNTKKNSTNKEKLPSSKQKIKIAKNLKNELERILEDNEIKAKERRSQKRKAEAIALEESGCDTIDSLLNFLPKKKMKKHVNDTKIKDGDNPDIEKESQKNPYILFIGQLSYDTTKEQILEYFQKKLKQDPSLSSTFSSPTNTSEFQVRLLTDEKTKKSKGMAFLQTYDPQIMYACLQLHHTYLNERRINVERSTGGKKDSKKRQDKLSSYRMEQKKFLSNTIDGMFREFIQNKKIEKEEFDDRTKELCKRYAPSIVHKTILEYIETKENKKDEIRNRSSYFIAMLKKVGKSDNDEDSKPKEQKWVDQKERKWTDQREQKYTPFFMNARR